MSTCFDPLVQPRPHLPPSFFRLQRWIITFTMFLQSNSRTPEHDFFTHIKHNAQKNGVFLLSSEKLLVKYFERSYFWGTVHFIRSNIEVPISVSVALFQIFARIYFLFLFLPSLCRMSLYSSVFVLIAFLWLEIDAQYKESAQFIRHAQQFSLTFRSSNNAFCSICENIYTSNRDRTVCIFSNRNEFRKKWKDHMQINYTIYIDSARIPQRFNCRYLASITFYKYIQLQLTHQQTCQNQMLLALFCFPFH